MASAKDLQEWVSVCVVIKNVVQNPVPNAALDQFYTFLLRGGGPHDLPRST